MDSFSRVARAAAIALVGSSFVGPAAAAPIDPALQHQLMLFGDILDVTKKQYVRVPDDHQLMEGAIQGMLQQGASGATYLSPEDFQLMSGAGPAAALGSLGLQIMRDGHSVRVEGVLPNSPAETTGIQMNDLLLSIDGHTVSELSVQEVAHRLRGPIGSLVEVTLQRDSGQPITVKAARQRVAPITFRFRMDGDVGIIEVKAIPAGAAVIAAVDDFVKAHPAMKGMILDLRGCHGGLLDGAIALADEFLDGGPVVKVSGRDPKDFEVYNAHPKDVLNGKPLVVLIGQDTRSGGEIVAAALQDRKRAKLVGLMSFGGGNIDTVIPLAGGKDGALRLTTAFTYRPSGAPLQKVGVTPDSMIAGSTADADKAMSVRGFFSEIDLADAADAEGAPARVRPSAVDSPPVGFAGDYQEARALEALRSMVVSGKSSN